jgi:DNA-binding transcriptional MerR regulator/methylmalonyl-CoA mutase cobalamin-binding subunit
MSRYTVKQVAALTGVSPATLRAWERRYTVVEPERTESQYRLYDDADVARLSRMAELVAAGTPASLAAQEVTREETLPADAHRPSPTEPPSTTSLVEAARSLDPMVLDRTLDEAFAAGSFEYVVDGWLMPSLTQVGVAWTEGRIDVAGEHFVSAAVHRRLAQSFEAAGRREGAPVVVVGLPPGAFHQLAVLAFATGLRRQGLDVRYLGADVPTESWSRTATQLRPQAVVIAVPTAADVEAAAGVVRVLAGSTDVLVGGGAAALLETDEATVLTGSIVESARTLAERLHAR